MNLDHVIPIEHGGPHVCADVRPTHPRRNREKRDQFPTITQLRRAGLNAQEPPELFDPTPYDAWRGPPPSRPLEYLGSDASHGEERDRVH
jgi:hypothetical protein